MRPLLPRHYYHSPQVFADEMERIFRRVWILAAIRPMLAEHLDFRTVEIAGVPVLLQNFHGRIRAFSNICRHRLSRIHVDEFGRRPLVCPYHLWCYDENGALASVPRNSALFQFDDAMMKSIRLREFRTEVVGGLVFVNLDGSPMPIAEQFDTEMLEMLGATDRMDSEFIYTRYDTAFNWKTGMENIKDPLHVQCLHKSSFPRNFDTQIGAERVARVDHDVNPRQPVELRRASGHWDVPIEVPMNYDWYPLVETLATQGVYRGVHLFPNVNLMIVDGRSFAVQIYNPVSPDRTEMQMMVTLTRPVRPFGHKPVVLWEHLKSDMTVLDEDIRCLEALQPGFAASPFNITHGAYETGILDFHSAYLGVMGEG